MSAQAAQAGSTVVGEDVRRTLVRVLRAAFPHDRFPDAPYERTAAALVQDAAATPYLAGLLVQGVRDLDSISGGPFSELEAARAAELLESIQGTPFFAAVKSRAIATLYNDPEVWALLGYEGPSFDKGGYLERGFDDLDWLPEPPL